MGSKRKNYSSNEEYNQKKRKHNILEPGMIGFLCTYNFQEKNCIRDAFKILNEFNDNKLYNEKNNTVQATEQKSSYVKDKDNIDDVNNDISTTLNKEIEELKAEYEKPMSLRTFQLVDTGIKNVMFIKTSLTKPLNLVTKIINEIYETKKQRTRYLLRLLPIEVTCNANMQDIKKHASVLFEEYFSQEPKTFSIIFNRHTRNNIDRNEIIHDLAHIVMQKNPGNKANLKNPELAVIVEIIRNICLISIAPNYFKYKKYNLLEICNIKNDLGEKSGIATTECNREISETETTKDQNNIISDL